VKARGFVHRSGPLRRFAERRAAKLEVLLARSGGAGNAYELSARAVARALEGAALFVPLGAALGALVWWPLVAVAALPVALLFYPEVKLRDRAAQRREGVERELPFFSVLVNVLGGAGVPLHSILDSVVGAGIFERMEREALIVRRDIRIFGMNPNDSLERLASKHPSRKFGDFLNGYTSKVRSGGDIPAYLAGESGSLLRELEETWNRYSARVGIVGSLMITLFGVLPLLLLVVGAFSVGYSVMGLLLYTGVGVPVFTVLMVVLAGRMQPAGETPVSGKAARSLLFSAPALLLEAFLGEAWVGAAVLLFAFFTLYGLSVREQLAEIREVERSLPGFTKDMMEFKRQEYDLGRAIEYVASSNRYYPAFDRLLSTVAGRVRVGVPLDEVKAETKSTLAKMVFFLLGEMERSGGGTVDTMFHLSSYTGRIVEMKRATRAEMRPYMALAYASPVLMAGGVGFVGEVIRSFGRAARPGLTVLHVSGTPIGAAYPLMGQISALLIVVSAAALGLIGAKMTDFTVRSTLKSSVNIVVAAGALAAMAALGLSVQF
jgi:archaeal flagellar protein FlaJ